MSKGPPGRRLDREEVAALYRSRRERFEVERVHLAARSRLVSHGRLVTFLGFAGALGWLLVGDAPPRTPLVVVAAACLLLYVALVIIHERVLRAERRAGGLAALNALGRSRLARDWEALPPSPVVASTGVAVDLDLVGRASLLQLLGPLGTPTGQRVLASWLLEPAPEEAASRQEAARELGPLLDWRQEFALRAAAPRTAGSGEAARSGLPDPGRLLAWCESDASLLRSPLRVWVPRLLGGACLLLLALNLAGVVRPYWLLLAIVNLAVVGLLGRRAAEVFEALGAREREYRAYAELIDLCGTIGFRGRLLGRIQAELSSGALSASAELRRLDRGLALCDARRNPLVSIPLQALVLWDLQVLWLLERWRARAGRAVRRWLELLGELEALAALGGLHHDEPTWAFPELLPAHPTLFRAEGLGHPLIPAARRVDNDVELGPEGSFLLVTGSNLSGKSTLLRAVGLATALAGAGGPVCARSLRLSPLRLGTSFRIRDSLEEGVSFFLAELRRLKEVVDSARASVEAERPLLYLFDEILLGTNIAERQVAVRKVIGHLLAAGAVGAVATHDLTLASAEGLAAACRPVHFREQLQQDPDDGAGGARMTFDYKLREGVAPTTNALKLLELLGLGGGA